MRAPVSTDQTIAWLVADVARLVRRDFDRRVRSLGLTQAQWRAIGHLARDAGLSQAELAERLEVKPITLARLVDRMQLAGWVERVADPSDRRVSRVFLTDNVRPILEELDQHANATFECMLDGLTDAARTTVVTALESMKTNLTGAAATAAAADTAKD